MLATDSRDDTEEWFNGTGVLWTKKSLLGNGVNSNVRAVDCDAVICSRGNIAQVLSGAAVCSTCNCRTALAKPLMQWHHNLWNATDTRVAW